jgi:endonuclease YncB( thermonuclease family)
MISIVAMTLTSAPAVRVRPCCAVLARALRDRVTERRCAVTCEPAGLHDELVPGARDAPAIGRCAAGAVGEAELDEALQPGDGGRGRAGAGGGNGRVAGDPCTTVVARWVDGDTLHVTLRGRDVTVRLLGAGAPETYRTPACGGTQATQLAARTLAPGSRVTVTTERASGDVVDAYHRRVAYIDGRRGDVGEVLMRAGHATIYRYHGRRFARLPRYQAAQNAARAARRGSWRICPRFGAR